MKSFDSDGCIATAEPLQWFITSFHFSSFLAINYYFLFMWLHFINSWCQWHIIKQLKKKKRFL